MVNARGWGRRLLKGLAWALGLFLGLNLLLVLVFRFVPVPSSGLMVQRRLEALSADKPYTARHRWVPLEEIAPSLGVAVIAAEDQNFADHFGFDWQAIEKAVQHNETSRRKRGASTVSQQTAKNLFLWSSRSWTRKGLEAWYTIWMELLVPKRRILEVYLGVAEMGPMTFGIEAAAQHWYGKPARQLRPSEAAHIIALLPSPQRWNPKTPHVQKRAAWIEHNPVRAPL